jgi:hypothetical protein
VSELLVCLQMQEKQRIFDQVGVCINKEVHDCFVFTYVMYMAIRTSGTLFSPMKSNTERNTCMICLPQINFT